MTLVRSFPFLLALGTTACVKQGQVRERPAPAIYDLCSDPRFQSMCTPASTIPTEQPIQIDTNLTTPFAHAPRVG